MTGDFRLNELEPYLPSSSEKKQAVMMYMVAGLALSMGKWEVSPFTHHHIKQSLGWLVFLMLTIFADLVLVIFGLILTFFLWVALLITIPSLTIGAMGIYQATKGKYIWENEMSNKFFALFSGIGNWVLNLFDSNHYQIIDAERYRTEDQFYVSSSKKSDDKKEEETKEVNQVNDGIVAEQAANNSQSNSDNSNSEGKTLDNDQQISINNQDIGIDLSGHEINNPENQINN